MCLMVLNNMDIFEYVFIEYMFFEYCILKFLYLINVLVLLYYILYVFKEKKRGGGL